MPRSSGPGWISEVDYETDLQLEDTAADVLESYGRLEGCGLAQAGFIDLLCDRWGCVVEGEGWVELCFVSRVEGADGSDRSHVRIVRMGVREFEGVERE